MGIDISILFGYCCVVFNSAQQPEAIDLAARIAELEAENQALQTRNLQVTTQLEASRQTIERLRTAYTAALEQLQLAKRRMFVAKAERREAIPEQLQLDLLAQQVEQLDRELTAVELAAQSSGAKPDSEGSNSEGKDAAGEAKDPTRKRRPQDGKPSGRRNLEDSDLPVIEVEITDPELEGQAERIGFETSYKLGWERGGKRKICIKRAVYQLPKQDDAQAPLRIVRMELPKELCRRSLLAPALIAHILVAKYMLGVPFARQESMFRLTGEGLDRSTMCRYAENIGSSLGPIVDAAANEAKKTAFCLATDATGVAIQPGCVGDGKRHPCRKGHFFVVVADLDHVFFEYQPKHTSKAVSEMFRGYHGYIQADANAVYDALFRGRPSATLWEEEPDPPPKEVGCYSHARRNFWDAAVCKHAEGLTGLGLVDAIFAADAPLWKLPPAQRQQARQQKVLPLVNTFFDWVREEAKQERPRGLVSKALGYALRQEAPLRRFLEDPRLKLENNRSERALRCIATGRKNWLFCGSDDHAQATANLFSLIASCKLHSLDPEAYLTDVIRVMPYWPRERYLELSPRYWRDTRSRLDPSELELPVGHVTVPPPTTE